MTLLKTLKNWWSPHEHTFRLKDIQPRDAEGFVRIKCLGCGETLKEIAGIYFDGRFV
jgi:hypothetical protein